MINLSVEFTKTSHQPQQAPTSELIDLNKYIDDLKPYQDKRGRIKGGYYHCPNCDGKLSFKKSDGTDFTCWNGCGDRSAIRKALTGGETTRDPNWSENNRARVAAKAEREATRVKKCLPDDIRDIEYRRIAASFGTIGILYKNDLLQRGLTSEQIEWMQAQGWISNWMGNEAVSGNVNLPGINPSDGKTLWKTEGLVISATNLSGQILGYQIYPKDAVQARAEGKKVKGNKYQWLSRSKGNEVKLATGELPLCIRIHPDTKLEQIDRVIHGEGFLKMSVAAKQRWDNGEDLNTMFVGFPGCEMGIAPKQIAAILKATPNCHDRHLYPDGDACNKERVFDGYKKLFNLIPDLQVIWADIHHKSADIDRLARANNKIKIIPFTQFEWIASERRLYNTLNSLSYKADVTRNEEYLSELPLPKGGQITLISSGCGTNKTGELAKLLKIWRRLFPEGRIIDIVHRNSIKSGHQTRLEIDDYKVGHNQDDAAINSLSSISICPDSLLRLQLENIPAHSLVTLDEIEAVVRHITEGGTLGSNTTPVQAHFTQIIDRVLLSGGAVIGLEDNITDTSVNALKNLTGNKYPIEIVNNTYEKFNWDVTIGCGSNAAFAGLLIDRLKNGESIFLATTSQKFGEAVERLVLEHLPQLGAQKRKGSLYPMLMELMAANYPVYSLMGWIFPEYAQIVREDAKTAPDTQDILEDPSAWLQRHNIRLFIGSPTIESGFNIHFPLPKEYRNCADAVEHGNYDYFTRVMGYFVNLDTRGHIQMLHRVRSNAPRDIFCKVMGAEAASIQGTTPQSIYRVRQLIADETSMACGSGRIKNNRVGEVWNDIDAQFSARSALASKHLLSYLHSELLDRGHRVNRVNRWDRLRCSVGDYLKDEGHASKDYQARLKEIGLEILTEENDILFDADGKALIPKQARSILHSTGVRFEKRQQAIKCILHHELPGAELSREFLMECITRNKGQYRREIESSWLAQNIGIAELLDRDIFNTQLDQPHILYRRAPKYKKRANLLAVMLPLVNDLLDRNHDGNDDVIGQIQRAAIKHADDLRKYFRLTIKTQSLDSRGRVTHSAITTAHKIIKLFGYQVESGKKLGSNDARTMLYHISNADCPHRQTIYDALERKHRDALSTVETEPTSTTCKSINPLLRVVDVNPQTDILEEDPPDIPIKKIEEAAAALELAIAHPDDFLGLVRVEYGAELLTAAAQLLPAATRSKLRDLVLSANRGVIRIRVK